MRFFVVPFHAGLAFPSDLDLVLVGFSWMTRDLDRIGSRARFVYYLCVLCLMNCPTLKCNVVLMISLLFRGTCDSIFVVLMTRESTYDSHHLDR